MHTEVQRHQDDFRTRLNAIFKCMSEYADGSSPFALSEGPAGDDPQGDHEHQQHGAGADGHQGLEHEAGVEVYPVQGPDAPRRGVREEFAVQQHHATYQVQPQEHGQGKRHVVWYLLIQND